jgi:hypothetical protein
MTAPLFNYVSKVERNTFSLARIGRCLKIISWEAYMENDGVAGVYDDRRSWSPQARCRIAAMKYPCVRPVADRLNPIIS